LEAYGRKDEEDNKPVFIALRLFKENRVEEAINLLNEDAKKELEPLRFEFLRTLAVAMRKWPHFKNGTVSTNKN
jgi:hypothetical protein